MSDSGRVVSVNVSEQKGTIKHPTDQITIGPSGVVDDAHAGLWHRQVSLLSQERIEAFVTTAGRRIEPGEFAENITVADLDLTRAAVLDRFTIGQVELEVSQIGKECHGDQCAIFREVGKCLMPSEGLFARVIQGGTVRAGHKIELTERPLRILIITLSDRAAAGQYTDRSGPRAREILERFLAPKRWHGHIEAVLLPDSADELRDKLMGAIDESVDVVLTLGATGIGPRDIAPETVLAVCDKTIPGIMEHIRVKFGAKHPSALLSRSVAALAGTTQVYALPGSPRAVEEYLEEILKALEHALFMIHGLDVH